MAGRHARPRRGRRPRCRPRRCAAQRSSNPSRSVVRRTRCCDESGTGSTYARGSGSSGLQRIRIRLVEPRADEHVLDLAPKPLLVSQPPEHRLAYRQRRRHVLEPEARHLLDEVDVAANVACTPARRVHRPVGIDAETEPFEPVALLGLRHGQAEHRVGVGGAEGDRRRRRSARRAPRPRRPSARRRVRRAAPTRTSLPLRPARDRRPFSQRVWLSVRIRCRSPLRSTVSGSKFAASSSIEVVASLDLRVRAAHHAGDPDRPLGVRDHEIVGASSARSVPSSVSSFSPARARRTTMRPPASESKSNACSGLPSASIT